MRAVFEVVGINNVLAKSIGSTESSRPLSKNKSWRLQKIVSKAQII